MASWLPPRPRNMLSTKPVKESQKFCYCKYTRAIKGRSIKHFRPHMLGFARGLFQYSRSRAEEEFANKRPKNWNGGKIVLNSSEFSGYTLKYRLA